MQIVLVASLLCNIKYGRGGVFGGAVTRVIGAQSQTNFHQIVIGLPRNHGIDLDRGLSSADITINIILRNSVSAVSVGWIKRVVHPTLLDGSAGKRQPIRPIITIVRNTVLSQHGCLIHCRIQVVTRGAVSHELGGLLE